MLADEHSSFVAAADQGRLDRPAFHALVTEVEGRRHNGGRPGPGGEALHEAAPAEAFGRVLVVAHADLFLVSGEVNSHLCTPKL